MTFAAYNQYKVKVFYFQISEATQYPVPGVINGLSMQEQTTD
jgi:hypothetical protein